MAPRPRGSQNAEGPEPFAPGFLFHSVTQTTYSLRRGRRTSAALAAGSTRSTLTFRPSGHQLVGGQLAVAIFVERQQGCRRIGYLGGIQGAVLVGIQGGDDRRSAPASGRTLGILGDEVEAADGQDRDDQGGNDAFHGRIVFCVLFSLAATEVVALHPQETPVPLSPCADFPRFCKSWVNVPPSALERGSATCVATAFRPTC